MARKPTPRQQVTPQSASVDRDLQAVALAASPSISRYLSAEGQRDVSGVVEAKPVVMPRKSVQAPERPSTPFEAAIGHVASRPKPAPSAQPQESQDLQVYGPTGNMHTPEQIAAYQSRRRRA